MKPLLLTFLIFASMSSWAQIRECEYSCSERCLNRLEKLKDRVNKIEQSCAGEERIRCRKTTYGYAPFKNNEQLGGSFNNIESCKEAIASTNSGVICLKTTYGVAPHTISEESQIGASFKDMDLCSKATKNIRFSMICSKTTYGYAPKNILSGSQEGSSVSSLDECLELL